MIEIRLIKSTAKSDIEGRMYDGQRLVESVTYDNPRQVKAGHVEWSERVVSLLSRMFCDKSLANEFQSLGAISFDENDSHLRREESAC